MKKSKASDIPEEFDNYYESLLGERWAQLKTSLIEVAEKTVLENPLGSFLGRYELDYASVLAGQALETQVGDRVLDMCAAPGGKSLVSIYSVKGEGFWVLNDISKPRVSRLKRVIRTHLPEELLWRVEILTGDAMRFGVKTSEPFDRVILDAPCSGERHLLASKKEMNQWKPSRNKILSKKQYGLLCAGWESLKPRGRIVYSTCSVSPIENDHVIEKFINKKGGRIVKKEFELGEATSWGWQIWPDQCDGWGPIYFSIVEKPI